MAITTDPSVDPVQFIKELQTNYLNTLALESVAPKPTYNVDGQTVDWTAYRASLIKTIEGLNMLIQMFDPREFQTVAI